MDYRMEMEEMLQEKVALQNVSSRSVMELIRNREVRWQLLTIVVAFVTLQLCGINAVSRAERTQVICNSKTLTTACSASPLTSF